MITIDQGEIAKLASLLGDGARRIVLVGHTNPDGDAIGAMLGWGEVLSARGHAVTCVVPNRYPSFLDWMEGIGQIMIFKENPDPVAEAIAGAEAIFSIDFNQVNRLEALGEVIVSNTSAVKVLIDHHLDPPITFDIIFSSTESSSTSYLVYNIVSRLYGLEVITRRVAEALYVGMMTDTGNFSFGNLTAGLFRAVADMVDRGINIPSINNRVYNSYSEGRMRLLGYVLGTKMKIIEPWQVAYITLDEEELRRFDFQMGDTEGFVNYPLTIKGMQMSAMFIENRRFIRVSLRSRGSVDVNIFARRYFDGGGHRNAAGGKSYDTMEQTVERFHKAVAEFFATDQ
ncbi:exopolyphosphatase [Bacteroidia bacterium]|nr:exopolyphosphatase [Bacteroidia bacterium]